MEIIAKCYLGERTCAGGYYIHIRAELPGGWILSRTEGGKWSMEYMQYVGKTWQSYALFVSQPEFMSQAPWISTDADGYATMCGPKEITLRLG